MFPRLIHHLALAWAFLSLHCVSGLLVNVTVDDAASDPITGNTFQYAPDGHWSVGNTCPGCLAQPDPTLVHDATWHDATCHPTLNETPQTMQFQFNGKHGSYIYLCNGILTQSTGSAIYVFGMLGQTDVTPAGVNWTTTEDLSFLIDGELSGSFSYNPPGSGPYLYNVCLFSNDALDSGSHTLELQNGRPGGINSLVLFDYIIYSQERYVQQTW